MKHLFRKLVIALILVAIVGGSAAWYIRRDNAQAVTFRTATVTRGDLLVSIGATGTVEPEEVIDVGAQVAGQIIAFGKDAKGDTVDYGSPVEANMVLAQIDDTLYRAQFAEAAAQVQQAQAAVLTAQANLKQNRAKLYQAQRDWDRAQKLGPASEALAQTTYDSYQSVFEVAQANIAVSEADIAQAQASLAQTQAAQQRAQRNLDYCTIKSPVKGVIIDRRVNAGQTVVASLNAPSLFLLAKDLTRMRVWVAVNEADIGKIHPGQPVSFTVDAFPGETFKGQVAKVRLNASMTQNVVTYTVEITTDNSSGRLLPYLTAGVQFELNRLNDVLMVPNAALRWTPTADQVDPATREAAKTRTADAKRPGGAAPGGPPSAGRDAQGSSASDSGAGRTALWVLDGKYVKPIPARTGQSDNLMTQIQGDGVTEGLVIVTGVQAQAAASSEDTTNPFAPRFPRGARSGAGTPSGAGGASGTGGTRGAGGPPPR
jgi:HlyD family secretion protein